MPNRCGAAGNTSGRFDVYLDLPTFRQANQDPIRPLPRELHANLVRRLTEAGARAVVFDIIFGQAGPNPEADAAGGAVADTDYRLNPLNLHADLPRGRTLAVSLRLNF